MKPSVAWSFAGVVVCVVGAVAVGCSSDPSPPGGTGQAGAANTAAGAANAGAGAPSAGSSGAPGTAGSAPSAGASGASAGATSAGAGAGTGGTPGTAGAGGASAGAGGGSAGGASTGFKCPAGPYTAFAAPSAKATHVAGTPPNDSFNMNNWTNVEGPVWIGDSLYFSEMTGVDLPPARILKLAPGGAVSVLVPDSGSNGLAVDGAGNLFAAVHKDGSISQVALPGGTETPIISKYQNTRFTSPNDLAIRSDGTIYFSDPKYQNNANPQKGEHLYRVTPPPTRTPSIIADAPSTPNGVTLSPDEKLLYVSGSGLKKFAVMTDGTLGAGSDFVANSGGDGMAVDCAGNLYVTGNSMSTVRVYSPAGALIGTIQTDGSGATTNVAFGGADHKTLYITAQGTEGQRGVWSVTVGIPGFPY